MSFLSHSLHGLPSYTSARRALLTAAACAALLALVACSNAEEPGEPSEIDTYLQDIRAEATRTSELNDRTEALLDHNEMLAATATAAYAEFNNTQEPLRVLAQDLEFLLEAFTELMAGGPGGDACTQLTITRLDAIDGVDSTLAQRIRAEFGCTVLQ